MPEHELEKLLGGFATDTLTEEERKLLFHAALDDQQLFNALADEQAMKELLADPAVRRRLLQALALHRGAGRGQSWLNRFMQPAGLAWAGGIAVGVFAVVFGLREYRESLRQASETAVLEEVTPTAPSTAPPVAPPVQAPPKDTEPKQVPDTASPPRSKTKETLTQTPSKPHASAPAPSTDRAPVDAPGNASEPSSSASDQHSTLPAAASTPESGNLAQGDADSRTSASARRLFHGQALGETDVSAREKQEAEPSPKPERFGLAKALDRTASVKPLALRYNILKMMEEEEHMKSAGTGGPSRIVTLRVESNQNAYLQVWTRTGDSLPELALPAKETGRISLKIAEGHRQEIVVPPSSDRLTIRLSRVPFGPITRQEAVMGGRGSVGQLSESVTGEQTTYVANSDASTAELAVEIPLRRNAP